MKKRTLFLSCLLALVLSTAALAADYTDVPADSWARESIDKAAEYGLMNGVGEGRFGLGRPSHASSSSPFWCGCSAGRA